MYKSKQLYAAALAVSLATATLAPVAPVAAAKQTSNQVVTLSSKVFYGGKVTLPTTHAGQKITWSTKVSKTTFYKYQTIKGTYGKNKTKIQIRVMLQNFPSSFAEIVKPQTVALNGTVVLPPTLKVRYANNKVVERAITWGSAPTDKPGKFSVTGTYTGMGKHTIKIVAHYTVMDNFSMNIIHTNDTHANLDSAPNRMTAIKEYREANPGALLIDAGDVFSGTLYFNKFKGQADLAMMNLMEYDMMSFGNHEFDLGDQDNHMALSNFVRLAKFPFITANVEFGDHPLFKGRQTHQYVTETKDGHIYDGIIREINGEKVGFFGLTTEETKDISSPGTITFKNYIDSAKASVEMFEKKGINKVVAVTHLGFNDNPAVDNDQLLAEHVDGIDVIVGAHSHTQLDRGFVVEASEKKSEPTVIVQTGEYGKFLGTLDVTFDYNGKVIANDVKLIDLKTVAADASAAALLKPYAESIAAVKNEQVGATIVNPLVNPRTSETNTISVRNSETALGNLITDGMLAKAKQFNPETVIAIQNGGGIRAAIPAGELTLGQILTTLTFGNTLATAKLTGAEILELMEESVGVAPLENGGFLHVSGLKVQYDSSKAKGSRIVSLEVKEGENYVALDSTKTYVVATNAFTAKGGETKTFAKPYAEGRVTDLGVIDWEVFKEYAQQLKTVDYNIEGRIVDIKK
ncbi:5'-nucleotidase C-terminal domain-containing protein [Exiguobacterium flavidum]|uniref:5'-nucleotidase C-terminal domain-containing protein n=1 Tax=Exiguobacterium flavidum TaxID=2184695 RepID=UPI000DF7F588|nr:5'-nucleotidase C-terminal domain-containing protein [Exiguobacterium flavidum]